MAPSSSTGPKAGLKAAKLAIDQKKFQDAINHAEEVLRADFKNYLALVFLGHSYDKLKKRDKAEESYQQAATVKPEDDKAWLGLRALYERENSVSQFVQVSSKLAEIYLEQGDQHKCQGAVDKAVTFAQKNGSREQYKSALELQLPDGPFYSFLEGRLPPPGHTYLRLAEITEELEVAKINHDIGEQRTRIGARKADVTINVKRAVYGVSKLEQYYQGIIDWTSDDEQRREFEEKKLMRAYDHLVVAKQEDKADLREHVIKMAEGMVIIKHPFELAWDLTLEWQDVENVVQLDVSVIRNYILYFPENGLSKVLKGYLASDQSPFEQPPPSPQDSDEEVGGVALETAEDKILSMNDGLLEAKDSLLAHRIMGEFYLQLEEYEPAVETIRKGLTICTEQQKISGLKFGATMDAMNTTLGTALIKYQSPRNHPEAKNIFEAILKRRPTFTPALLGTGLILEEEENFPEALDYLTKALKRDPKNLTISAEAAWCDALNGNWSRGLQDLQSCLRKLKSSKERDKNFNELLAQVLYRIGRCQWEVDPSRVGRKDRKTGPYSSYLESVKTDPNYAPAYTSLGIYYEDYAKDKRRARQCFQRAFDLSPSEVLAAERLARSFADLGEWEVVEVIAQRVIDSGKARPPPPISGASKRKGISWPFSALGVVQMNRQDYQNSIVSFLAALRINPGDYHSYVGLGESYHNSGRYNSALRTFTYAESPEDGVIMNKADFSKEDWFTKYMLANVRRELGDHDDAIEAYEKVLKERPDEFGVEIALLQTLLEKASVCLETGFFGRAVESAVRSFDVAEIIVKRKAEAFNLWKSVADACLVFASVQERISEFPLPKVAALLVEAVDTEIYDLAAPNVEDNVGKTRLNEISDSAKKADILDDDRLSYALSAAILAQKRALHCVTNDIHAQAVAWYNLGWTQYRAQVVLERRNQHYQSQSQPNVEQSTKSLLRAAVQCFKRAIELEPGNADFWNALGATTATLNGRVSQHSFVRSLHVDELRNPSAWTNLGTLALLKNDMELAHDAFARGQSADPDYAGAWTGEGTVAMLLGDKTEAWAHFEHAVGISQADFAPAKEEHAKGVFDEIILTQNTTHNPAVIQPVLLALQQLTALRGPEPELEHIMALFRERAGDYETATSWLEAVCADLEAEYEESEDSKTLIRFAQAKADLARSLLAIQDFAKAADEADMALSLTEDEIEGATSKDVLSLRSKTRLSARLTVGLAKFYLDNMDEALATFKLALEETKSAPDVVCALAQVLWAKGGKRERSVAKEQLFEAFSSSQDEPDTEANVGPVLMLGAMAVLENPPDLDTAEAVREELEGIRMMEGLSRRKQDEVRMVLGVLNDLLSGSAKELRYEAQKGVMLFPNSPGSWTRLANVINGVDGDLEVDDQTLADMALELSARLVAPRGDVSAEELSQAYARTGKIADAQRAVMVKPGIIEGWKALIEGVEGLITVDSPGGIPLR